MAGSLPRWVVALLLGSAAFVAVIGVATADPPKFLGPAITHPSVAPDFTLRDQRGGAVRLSAERGKVVMITFLYTHCPDLCPLTAAHIDAALRRLGPRRNGVVALAVTIDPKGDTRSAVRAYVRSHRLPAEFHYLTGSRTALERIWRLYNVTPVRPGGPDPDHTLYILLLDRSGKTRVLFDALGKPAAMAHDLGILLGSSAG
jgi:protein SCO1/2